MKRLMTVAALAAAPLLVSAAGPAPQQTRASTEAYLERYCISCHTSTSRNNFRLDTASLADARADAKLWESVLLRLRTGYEAKPPGGRIAPPHETAEAIRWIEGELDRDATPNLMPAGIRRMNRAEYRNAIRDLLALNVDIAPSLPQDDSMSGFDNVAEVLASQIPTQAYVDAATSISRLAISPANASTSGVAIFTCRPAEMNETDCARQILAALARRAFRGRASPQDINALLAVFQSGRAGASFERGIEAALRVILMEPKFLFRTETEPGNVASGQSYRISDYELASRLSFFLWSAPPDDALLNSAASNQLHIPEVLERETRRMLSDPRSLALTENFAAQWLLMRLINNPSPSPAFYPQFDEPLRKAMLQEMELFFDSIVREDRGVGDLLTADYTFVNERLARHYGIPGITGTGFQRVRLDGALAARRGLLGKALFLTVTSRPDRTSPVARGRWILGSLLGIWPPSPPPTVPALKPRWTEPNPPAMREIMLTHRANQACVTCHAQVDAIGLALEYFDGVGTKRADNPSKPLDLTSVLIDGTMIDGPAGLRDALADRLDQFAQTMTNMLWTYAYGRGVETDDMSAIRSVTRSAARDNYRFSSVILGIVGRPEFQMNKGMGNRGTFTDLNR